MGKKVRKKPNWTFNLPSVVKAVKDIPSGTIIDAELYSNRGRRFIPSVMAGTGKAKPEVYIFDVIYFKNEFVGNLTLKERKAILSQIKIKPPLKIIEYKPVISIKKHLIEIKRQGYEGIILKKLSSPYILSAQAPIATENWRKIK
uniref:ATP-dependent DNA ligase family profile domain-containing protein n=1 Tax=candidate division WOR-3 bacterium TaxID=2052148 RepID=A0A7C6EBT4_UNCW3